MEMDPLEVFEVEMPGEDYGAEKYREIIMDILQDLGLIRSIGRLYVYVDIEAPYFAVFGMIRGKLPPLKVSDVGDLVPAEGGFQITVEDEEHMANLIRVLWSTFGRDKVEQPERNVLVVLSDESPQDLVVADTETEFRRDLMDALVRIAPEGFRNRRNEMGKESFFFLAAEETIKPEMVAEAKERLGGMRDA
ncbi:methanogenesis marker 17 protein [Methanocrinis sp.]|uniref:methanogenesis marker 17 protein n=1 Tax=Methanocrinis sp. TaxID=3101522 RepID=UPI003D0E5656